MTHDINYQSNILVINSSKRISFRYNIAEILALEEVIVIRLDIPPKVQFNENIYGVNYTGDILWQIYKLDHIYDDSPYTGMKYVDNTVILYNWDGLDVTIDPNTGNILKKSYSK